MEYGIQESDYLFIGQVCHDITEEGINPGGTAYFGMEWVSALGLKPGLITAFGSDFGFNAHFVDYACINLGSDKTTQFRNIYQDQRREQYIKESAVAMDLFTIDWLSTFNGIVHLAPIYHEFSMELIEHFDLDSFVVVTPQGWMRSKSPSGLIQHQDLDWEKLRRADLIILSDDDLNNDALPGDEIHEKLNLVVLTQNKNGAVAYDALKEIYLPSYPVQSNFPTGAGDVFASVFSVKYHRTFDVKQALIWGHCAASLHVEDPNIPREKKLNKLRKRVSAYEKAFL